MLLYTIYYILVVSSSGIAASVRRSARSALYIYIIAVVRWVPIGAIRVTSCAVKIWLRENFALQVLLRALRCYLGAVIWLGWLGSPSLDLSIRHIAGSIYGVLNSSCCASRREKPAWSCGFVFTFVRCELSFTVFGQK